LRSGTHWRRGTFETRGAGTSLSGAHFSHARFLWPSHADDAHYLRIAIGRIRDKLGDDAADPRFILTEPCIGFRLLSD
jgi:DNA-binding response OmpR family regulator